ncbi:uncharacterized protein [Rutidosis leptorrhynchoides]|uniref:uncharacterized protein n=1 Tax=Rutidosis leptorrhynchoides TaxID=125765 RepID=UPI003A990359
MRNILGLKHELPQTLQSKDQDTVNVMNLVDISKQRLQDMRENGWDKLVKEVSVFCKMHDISMPNMDEIRFSKGRKRQRVTDVTNLHHYRVELFYIVVDMQLRELGSRFTEVNIVLLRFVASLNPVNSFLAFDKNKLIQLAKLYPLEFSPTDLVVLENQLETYIIDVRRDNDFESLKRISELAQKLVQTGRNIVYPLVYQLMKLALILPVATAIVERALSSMNIVKNRL